MEERSGTEISCVGVEKVMYSSTWSVCIESFDPLGKVMIQFYITMPGKKNAHQKAIFLPFRGVGFCFFFQAEDGIRDVERSRGLGDVYKRQG